jgi:phosphoglucomutase
MQMTEIKFGTSGWRGILAEDFTFANARLVCQGIADYLKQEGIAGQGLVIGYDTRFRSEAFAAAAVEVMAANGITCHFTTRDCPTPVVSWAIRAGNHAGAINITASHNPPEYNGIKFSPATGGPAPSKVTDVIEALIRQLHPESIKSMPLAQAREQGLVFDIDPRSSYLQHLKGLIDTAVLKRSGLKVVVDLLFGAGRDYLDTFLREAGVQVETINGYRDAYFGGHRPEPCEACLQDLAVRITATSAHLGLAVDADADRFGVMDAAGVYRDADTILALLLDYLIETRGWDGGVAKSVATTHLIDRVAAYHRRPVYVTKVGFKHLGQYIIEDRALMIGEESDGFSMKHHLPEKDGILACVLVAEMVARKGKGLPELIDDLFAKVGPVYNRHLNFFLAPDAKARLLAKLQTSPARFANLTVTEHLTLDGHKYVLEDGSWVCFRPSGTEPVLRFYYEASSLPVLDRLKSAGEALVREA